MATNAREEKPHYKIICNFAADVNVCGRNLLGMERMGEIWRWLGRHKYLIVCVIFFVNLLFLDHNNLVRRYRQRKEIATLRAEKELYTKMYERDTRQLEALRSNPKTLEKIARERYFMKKADEDVFVFEYGKDGSGEDEAAE